MLDWTKIRYATCRMCDETLEEKHDPSGFDLCKICMFRFRKWCNTRNTRNAYALNRKGLITIRDVLQIQIESWTDADIIEWIAQSIINRKPWFTRQFEAT